VRWEWCVDLGREGKEVAVAWQFGQALDDEILRAADIAAAMSQPRLQVREFGPTECRVRGQAIGAIVGVVVDEPPLQVPMITPDHQLAEKLHAYTRRYSGESSSRARDLFDMLVIAEQIVLPDGATVTAAARETFRLRSTPWPPRLREPPDDWAHPWTTYTAAHALRWTSLDDAHIALRHFWNPILDGAADSASVPWDPTRWRWMTDT
jgi:hypothetical protein